MGHASNVKWTITKWTIMNENLCAQAPESSNAASGSITAAGAAGQAEEVERRNAAGGTNTTPELANDATGLRLGSCNPYCLDEIVL